MGLFESLLQINTNTSIREAITHTEDMLRLCRGDNIGVRTWMPALYLRVGRDQKCYDMIKWYGKIYFDSHYDWGNMDLPFLDITNADAFESFDDFIEGVDLSEAASLTLLKIRLLVDLRAVKTAAVLGDRVPQEILDSIRGEMVSPIIGNNATLVQDIMDDRNIEPYIQRMEAQVSKLHQYVHKKNKYFWPALLEPGDNLTVRPAYCSPGEVSEMQICLQQNYAAWTETPKAIDVIKAVIQKSRS